MRADLCFLPADLSHLSALVALEAECFPSDPWGEEALAAHLSSPTAGGLLVTDPAGKPLGAVLYGAIVPEWEIYRVCVTPSARGQGIGRALLVTLHGRLVEAGYDTGMLEVRRSNTPAIRLYESCGYVQTGVRRDYYRHPTEDALIYQKRI